MESKKTTELRGKKTSVRTKLAAAVAMLLVSTIMLTTTTYAWFVLSTAPEVKGMSTTVGSNGSLEIALLNNTTGANVNTISSGVGDSSVVAGVTEANVTWGNLVSLNDAAYGLSKVTLYPAALNVATKVTGQPDQLKNLFNILKYPTYGVDGRVASLSANTEAGTQKNNTFQTDHADYGVRAIGSVTSADPKAHNFADARNKFASSVRSAQSEAQKALSDNAQGLVAIVMAQAYAGDGAGDADITYDGVAALYAALTGLKNTANNVENALKYAMVARSLAKDSGLTEITFEDAVLDPNDANFGTQITALNAFKTKVDTAIQGLPELKKKSDGQIDTEATYKFSQIEVPFKALLSGVTIANTSVEDIKAMGGIQKIMEWATKLNNPEVTATGGLLVDAADFVGQVSCRVSVGTTTGTMVITPVQNPTYLTAVGTIVNAYESPNASAESSIITTTYGYIVDLAVRCSSDGKLMLSNAVNRVTGDDETAGAGSTFTKTTGDIADLSGLRIVFVDAENNNILGVAGLVATANAETEATYALHMFHYTVDADGCVALGAQANDDTITTLTADKIKKISVLVYLDGGSSKYAAESASGTLNLQFRTDANLVPMEYTGYVTTNPATAGLVISGDNTVVAGQNITLSATYNGQAASNVKWSITEGDAYASIGETTGVLNPVAAGEVTVTATYTPEGAGSTPVTATYTVTVTAAAGN